MRSRLISALNSFHKAERGAAMPFVFILLLVAAIVMPQVASMIGTGIVSGSMYDSKSQELYAADAGVEDALWTLGSNEPWEILALIMSEDDGDSEKYIYDMPDPVGGKTIHYEIRQAGEDASEDGYIIQCTATGSDGSSTSIEVWAVYPYREPVAEFAAVAQDGDLTLNAVDMGSPDTSPLTYEDAGDGHTKEYSLGRNVVEYSEVVTLDSVEQVRDTDYTINYVTGQLEFAAAPPNGAAIVADYDYYSGRLNIYADGDIYFDGSVVAYVDCWLTYGHDVYVGGTAFWEGEKVYTTRLRVASSFIPDTPEDTHYGDMSIKRDTPLGDIHITGQLNISKGVLTLTGPVWVDGMIKITGGTVTGTDPGVDELYGTEDDMPYWMISEYPGVGGITVQGGDIYAILYALNSDVDSAGNPNINGAILSSSVIDMTGAGDLQNELPMYADPGAIYPMDVQAWKIS